MSTSIGGDILTGGDDGAVWRWSPSGEPLQKICDAHEGSGVTLVRWMPGSGRKKGAEAARDAIVVGCSNGFIMFVSAQSGRVEKTVPAHQGAVTGLVWSPDGGAMVTSGEDGTVKGWSASGFQRATIASAGKCIYTLVWGAESTDMGGECVLFTTDHDVIIKPLGAGVKRQTQWKAHNRVILCADWSRMNNLIVTGAEDGLYKVWDPYGRNIYTAQVPSEYPITSIAFAPDGDSFAVGSYRTLRVCDRTGWTHCRETCSGGSVLSMAWTADSTQVAMGSGSGLVGVAHVVDRKTNWRHLSCTHTDEKKLLIQNVVADTSEVLMHRDKVIKVSIGYDYLVVATATQCYVYDVNRWGHPLVFDLRDFVVSLQQSQRLFFLCDCAVGIQVFTYEGGKPQATIKPSASLRPESLSSSILSLSNDTVAVRDPVDARRVLIYDPHTGRTVDDAVVEHSLEISELVLSQFGPQKDRKLAFIDRNRDLYITIVHARSSSSAGSSSGGGSSSSGGAASSAGPASSSSGRSVKIATMVSSVAWNDQTETLIAIADSRLVTWLYPSVVFVDRDLLQRTRSVRDDLEEFGRNDSIVSFFGSIACVRRGSDGALLSFGVSPFPRLLYEHLKRNDWEGAMKLCRYLKEPALWGVLAALAVKDGELYTAEVSYAALGDVDKLRYISRIKEVPSMEGRQAELALFQRKLDEAERVLVQAGFLWQALEMHMNLHNWETALALAIKRKHHIDTVLGYRQRHLTSIGKDPVRDEWLEDFRKLSKQKIDWGDIEAKIQEDKDKEAAKARPYQSAAGQAFRN